MIKFPHLKKFVVEENRSIKEVLRIINLNAKGFVIVVDKQLFFRGLITDGDIRRAILKNSNLKRKIKFFLKKSFFLDKSSSVSKINTLLKKKKYIPILDKKRLVGLYIFNKEMLQNLICDTVIFAGGKGIRMGNLTKNIPKPLLKINNVPIVEQQMLNFMSQGFRKFFLLLNYKFNKITEYFDKKNIGANISYIKEQKYLGTAGPLSLIDKNNITNNFIVINGDIVTKLNFKDLLKFHIKNNNQVTICLKKYSHQVPFGVYNGKNKTNLIEEKPVQNYFVNSGIYIFKNDILKYIKKNSKLEMNDFINLLFQKNIRIKTYVINEIIYDIGDKSQYIKIKNIFSK
jgi:dTDP-glucose pyrophosphorylase